MTVYPFTALLAKAFTSPLFPSPSFKHDAQQACERSKAEVAGCPGYYEQARRGGGAPGQAACPAGYCWQRAGREAGLEQGVWSGEYQRHFWHNVATGENTWDDPGVAPATAEGASAVAAATKEGASAVAAESAAATNLVQARRFLLKTVNRSPRSKRCPAQLKTVLVSPSRRFCGPHI